MKAISTPQLLIFCLGVLAVVAALIYSNQPTPVHGASFPSAPSFLTATTTQTFSVTTSTRIAATTTNPLGIPGETSFTRAYLVVCNPNANPVALNLDGDKPANLSTGNATIVIAAAAGYNACYELTDDRMVYNGSITASSTSQAATPISVKQYVY